ncbi:hypothetical protein [Lacrimispora amygdalina]|uniref:hypothetical protein n=1 Tax=Lacrimispora amygdalina TaxID=253257 RepID=UPI000BE48973|nr:hypothetical protein [Lacrimispora amygdalina]
MLKEKNIKKILLKNVLTLLIIFSSFSSTSFASSSLRTSEFINNSYESEPNIAGYTKSDGAELTEQHTKRKNETVVAEEDIDEENIGEIVDEIKNLDKNDMRDMWNELDNIKIKREKEKVVKEPIKDKIINYIKISLLWFCNQIMKLRGSIVVLIILYSILIYLKKRKKVEKDDTDRSQPEE